MAIKQIRNKRRLVTPVRKYVTATVTETKPAKAKNNKAKKEKNMTTTEQVNRAEEMINNLNAENVKVLKKDKGLIERTESSKIVLTEDNRQVLND